ncbi:MAG TPA: MerR family transcriptional regulator [Acidimicrobiales bacterium]|nr:MerR family transcriptional regulator [Acidimicrobiales bacterium]
MAADGMTTMTIDDLATVTGTTTRRIRSLQTRGLLPHPNVLGRTGFYDGYHRDRVESIVHLQDQGFSLESIAVLFDALRAGRTLADLLGVVGHAVTGVGPDGDTDSADLYGFADLQAGRPAAQRRRPLLSVVPTTVWDESQAS